MPSYKTHSIHGELVFNDMEKRIDLDLEDLKSFSMGPDTLILPDKKAFDIAHKYRVRDYFEMILKRIKEEKLLDNKEVMAFLYGQLDHFILDAITHPLIYYMTEGEKSTHKIKPHGLCEMWIDDYIMNLYDTWELFYYKKKKINDSKLKSIITDVYSNIYNVHDAGNSYEKGIKAMALFDSLIRRNLIGIVPLATFLANTGDIISRKNNSRVEDYINSERGIWYNPETLEMFNDSFFDLFIKAKDISLETIEDVNRYLYDDRLLTTPFIICNISYNTGINCDLGQHFKRIRKY